MRAVRIHAFGDASELRLEDAPSPRALGPNDVLVAVRAAGVNPVDAKIRSGAQRALMRARMPLVLGMDLAGDVVAVGERVRRFAKGDAVYASPSHRRMGAYAELAVVDERELAKMPKTLSYVEAASLPLAVLTAWDALVRHGRVQSGERVFIQGGAGGVGSLAVQLAKHLGADVIATASAKNVAFVESLGADDVIDYERARYEEVARDCDFVLESIGPHHWTRALASTRRGGRMIVIATGLPEAAERHGPWLGALRVATRIAAFAVRARVTKNVRFRPIVRVPSGEVLAEVSALVDGGALRPVVDEVLPLGGAADAHRRLETGRGRGKLVLDLAA